MISINDYNPTLSSMRKAWKAEFRSFLIDYYRPSLVQAEDIFKAIGNVDSFIKKHLTNKTPLLRLTDIEQVQDVLRDLLSHKSFAMGLAISSNDKKVIVTKRYFDFLKKKIYQKDVQGNMSSLSSTKLENDYRTTEGLMKENLYFRRQRNRSLRNQCAKRDNYTCQVCGLNFMRVYGDRGDGFIEIHHLKPMSSYEGEHEIKLDELIALCSNCHSMVHYGGELLDIEELKRRYQENKANRDLL